MVLLRWNAIRGILQSNQLDAVVLILGIDSCFNEGCSQLFDFLFVNGPRSSPSKVIDDDESEDIFVIITLTAIHLYCNPNNAHLVLPTVSKLHDVYLHCLSIHQIEVNDSLNEDYKAMVFVSVLKDLHRIGVPYCATVASHETCAGASFDPMRLEEWPLVQAYAAEDLGGHGFFTLTHTIVDITSDLEALYSKLDPLSLADLMRKGVPGYLQQWLGVLNTAHNSGEVGLLTHERLSESFSLYTRHQLTQGSPLRECEPSGVWPGYSTPFSISCPPDGAPLCNDHCRSAVHMVCHLCDPRGPLCAWRTYFPTPVPSALSDDAWLVRRLYYCLSEAVQVGIGTYVETQRPQKTVDVITKHFVERCGNMGIAEPLLGTFRDNLEVVIAHVDLVGRSQQTQRGVWRPLLNQISAKVHNIPSNAHPHEVLGAVAYGDTFVDSMVILDEVVEEGEEEEVVHNDEQDEGQDVSHFVLTSQVPVFRSVMSAQAQQFAAGGDVGWGDSLGDVGEVHLVNPAAPDCTILVKLHVFKDALVISDSLFGVMPIPYKDIQSMLYYNGDQPTSGAVLTIQFSGTLQGSVPVEMLNERNTVVLLAQPHTTARRSIEQLKDLFEHVHELPKTLEKIYQSHAMSQNSSTSLEVDKDAAFRGFEQHFSRHFGLACNLHHPVRSTVLQCVLSSEPAIMEGKVVVSIVTGVPGSYQDVLVSELSSKSEGDFKWILLRESFASTQGFSTIQLQESLTTIVLNVPKKSSHGRRSLVATKRRHVLLLTPGLTGALEVLQAICTHPQKSVAGSCTIGAVVLCVDPTNVFVSGRTPFPNVLHNMNLATTIVLTGSQQHPNYVAMAQEIQQWIKYCSPHSKVISAPRGVVSRPADVDLILTEKRWKGVGALVDGHISCSGHVCVHTLQPKFDVFLLFICLFFLSIFLDTCLFAAYQMGAAVPSKLVLRFMTALSRRLLDRRCLELLPVASPVELNSSEGLVYHIKGCIQFGDCSSFHYYEFTRQSGQLSATEQDQGGTGEELVPSVMVFTGIGLKEDALRSWVQGCQHEATRMMPVRTKLDLTVDELHQLKQRCQQLPLPPGHFFTGQYYSSFDGEKSTQHPMLDDVIASYLAEQNAAAQEHNVSVRADFDWV